MRHALAFAASAVLALGCDCSGMPAPTDTGGTDAPSALDVPRTDGGGAECGNTMVEGTEQCDDGNTDAGDGCSATCELECGDGVVSGDELCDTGIAVGTTGACPTECDDADACTIDSLDGADCSTTCSHGPITAPTNGDMCCPPGADASTDDDCAGTCGDGIRSGAETCDTAIAAGSLGACPADCDDGMSCTADTLDGGGTCDAVCTNLAITMAMNGDGCCPPGETPTTDDDCMAGCGDMRVDAGETCDTAITSGPGACPTTCSDGMACTTDVLANGGTCTAVCRFRAITTARNGDGCCPTGATIGTDDDCAARCGDRVVTSPETCDDGNTMSGDGCATDCTLESVSITAFRITDLDLRDPHVFASVIGCNDVTNSVFGIDGVNPLLQQNIQMDGDMPPDGLLDLSIVQVFSPLLQTAGSSTMGWVSFPDCTAPMSSTRCTLPAGGDRTASVPVMNLGGGAECLPLIAGTTRGTYGSIVVPTAPAGGGTCYSASAGMLTVNLGGIPIVLRDAQIGGEYFGSPATEIRDGLIRGFISYADAMTTIIPDGTTGIGAIDGQPLASLLRTGSTTGSMAGACGSSRTASDLDMAPDGTAGWYFYLNFSGFSTASPAPVVPYTEM